MDTTMSKSSKAFLLHASRKRSHSHDVGCSSDACISSDGTPPFDNNSFPLGFLSVHARLVQRRPSVQAAGIVHEELHQHLIQNTVKCIYLTIIFVTAAFN
jgi:hypothetical protein